MSNDNSGVVVIGSSHAGVELCSALRQRGFTGSLDLVGSDPALPYQRPPLSKDYIKHPGTPQALKAAGFYEANGIALRTGIEAVAIDRDARQVVLADGTELPYGHLVLATGARNRRLPVPGLESPRLLELRTLADADRIAKLLPDLERLAIIGAGFIGLEAAGLLAQMGKAVDVIDIAPRVMQRAVSPAISVWFERFHRASGVRLHLSESVSQIESQASSVILHLTSGARIEADAVLLAAGVVANDDLARTAGLDVADGIVVDAFLQTSDPHISAIGDCARFPSLDGARTVRLESVQNAVDQARCLAARLTGSDARYDALPWFWSVQGEVRLQIAGLALPGAEGVALTQVVRGDPAGEKLSVFVYSGARLLAVESINHAGDHMFARKILGRGGTLSPGQAEDTTIELKTLALA